MRLLQDNELINHLTNIIHKDTQQHTHGFDLTVDSIYRFTKPASLDFGGSEFTPAGREELVTQKKNEDDDYGWWHLSEGHYQALMNESLREFNDTLALLTSHEHSRKAGIITNTGFITQRDANEPLLLNFRVPENGCNIKENARLATLHLFST